MNNIIKNSVGIAISALKKNMGRTMLTVLGIVIGITAVIAVLSIGQAIRGLIIGQVEAFGTDYIQIEVKTPQTSQTSSANSFSMVGGSTITTLKIKDAEDIAKLDNITKFYAAIMGQEIISFENEFKKSLIFGASSEFINIDSSEIETGRFYSDEEDRTLSKVVVLGSSLKKDLFGDADAISAPVKVGNDKYQVIGVLKERGATFGFDMDNMAYIPVQTAQKRLLGVDYVSFITAQVSDSSIASQTAEEIELILRDNHKITDPDKEDFAVTTMEQAMEMLDVVIVGVQFLLIALGSISLIVGGVGIMNIMYVSVTERTGEIGLRKSIGAKNKSILWQFLSEAVILTLAGGIIGIIFGVFISFIVSIIAQALNFDWTFAISWPGMLSAVLMSVIVGLVFGLYPAKQASDLDPIEALRYE